MADLTDLPDNYRRRMQAARLLMSAAGALLSTSRAFSRINTAQAIGDIYAAFEALGMQDFSNDGVTCNYRANILTAADEIRESLREMEA
tara:strand:+ start:354 stop:620 length:267 start_codon:yes stop_codon:yes gene_type:complete